MEIGDWSHDSGSAYFIAEAGVNHNGDVEIAERLVDLAVDVDADAVKFQTFEADSLVVGSAPTARYQRDATGGIDQRDLLNGLELSFEDQERLMRHCKSRNIEFLSTPFGFKSASYLSKLGVKAFKIGSGDLTNHPLLRQIAQYNRPMIISTGMSSLEEVTEAFDEIRNENPNVPLALLHCVSAYPTDVGDVNLKVIRTLEEEFPAVIGFSDHTMEVEMPALAVAAGARIVEKHFTLDRSMSGPDHGASLEPDQLERAISLVRDANRALGDGVKRAVPAEEETMRVARKGLYATSALTAGETIAEEDIAIKRPSRGIAPNEYSRVVGRILKKDVEIDEPLTWGHFEQK